MHLLFVSSLLPDEDPTSGFQIANQAIVEEYRRQGVRLSFAGFALPDRRAPARDELELGRIVIENAAAGRGRKLAWVAGAMARGLPVSAAKVAGLGMRRLAARLAEAGPVDGLVLNSIQMPAAYPALLDLKPSIFISHNVEHRSAMGNAENARDPLMRRLFARDARILKTLEARVNAGARVVHTLSREDGEAFGLEGDPRWHPLALSIGRPPRPDDGRRDHDIGMIGSWSWAPNRVGLDWFVERIVPLLPLDMRISIAGRFDGPPPQAPANVTFHGFVPDAQMFVRASRVVALATRGGTGVQLKTIECLEEGMPAVATDSALRGVHEKPDNVRVENDPVRFAAALIEMVDAEREGRIGRRSGLPFMLGQKHAFSCAIRAGLNGLDTALSAHPRASIAGSGETEPPRERAGIR